MTLMKQINNACMLSLANWMPRLSIFNRIRWFLLKLGGGKKISSSAIWAPIDVRPFGCLGNLTIGKGTFINTGFRCGVPDGAVIEIGENCAIGPRVSIETVNHHLRWNNCEKWGAEKASVRIGDRVWIGSGVIILPGVNVGSDSVIAAGAVVTKDVPEKKIVAGVPARIIRDNY